MTEQKTEQTNKVRKFLSKTRKFVQDHEEGLIISAVVTSTVALAAASLYIQYKYADVYVLVIEED